MKDIGLLQVISYFDVGSSGNFKSNYSFEDIRKMSTSKHFDRTKLIVDFFSEEKKFIGQISISFGEINKSLMEENLKLKRDSVFSFNVGPEIYFHLDFLEKSKEGLKSGKFSIKREEKTGVIVIDGYDLDNEAGEG